jgi:hypothetical protein
MVDQQGVEVLKLRPDWLLFCIVVYLSRDTCLNSELVSRWLTYKV